MTDKSNPHGFVAATITRVKNDTGFRAVMSRAAHPAFESAAWEYLLPFCNIENDFERIPFALIGAAIARNRPERDGTAGLGEAFHRICRTAEDREREGRRFRRLLSCDSAMDLCQVVRPAVDYLVQRGALINYEQLLRDLLFWSQQTKLRWTVQFYGSPADEAEGKEAAE